MRAVSAPDGVGTRDGRGARRACLQGGAQTAVVRDLERQRLGRHRRRHREPVAERTRRAGAVFLAGKVGVRRRGRDVVVVPLRVLGPVARGRRQRQLAVLRPVEVEGRGEVTGDRPAPRGDVGLRHPVAGLDESDQRGVVERLGTHPAAGAPRRHDEHRDADPHAVVTRRAVRPGVVLVGGVDARRAGRVGAVGVGGHDVVEEAVVLVVGDEQRRLRPDVLVGGQGVQDLRDVPGAVVRRPVRVLGERLRRYDPRHLRQLLAHDVRAQLVEERAALRDIRAGAGALVQRAAGRGVAVLVEVQQRVVAVVADIGIVGVPPRPGLVEADTGVLIDLPAHAGVEQALGVGVPLVAGLGVVDHRAAVLAVVAVPPRPHVVAVRVGRAEHPAVVVVADGEGVGQGVVEGDVRTLEVRHRGGALGRHPLVVAPAREHRVRGVPVVGQVLDEGQAEVGVVGAERQHVLRAVGLVEHRLAAGQRRRVRVAEATDAAHRAEVVVERPVLLHQDHDVLDVLDRPLLAVSRNGRGAGDALRQHRQRGGAPGQLQETATIDGRHTDPPTGVGR